MDFHDGHDQERLHRSNAVLLAASGVSAEAAVAAEAQAVRRRGDLALGDPVQAWRCFPGGIGGGPGEDHGEDGDGDWVDATVKVGRLAGWLAGWPP